MKKISFFVIGFAYLICASAQDERTSGDAVWVWKVKNKNSIIYLMGEAHKFVSMESLNIDYSLGESIYSKSNIIWTEPAQQTSSNKLPKDKISNQLSPTTFSRLERANLWVISSVNKHKTSAEKEQLLEKMSNEIDKHSAFSVYAGVHALAEIKRAQTYKVSDGMSAHLLKIDAAAKVKKIKAIEKSDSVEETWKDICSNHIDSEILISAALKYFEEGSSFQNSFSRKLQNLFLKRGIEIGEFLALSESSLEAATIRKCNIVPRNKSWLPLIINALENDGAVESFLVGNSHIIGSDGLISLLRQQGYSDIKRIYSFE